MSSLLRLSWCSVPAISVSERSINVSLHGRVYNWGLADIVVSIVRPTVLFTPVFRSGLFAIWSLKQAVSNLSGFCMPTNSSQMLQVVDVGVSV